MIKHSGISTGRILA